MCSLVKPVSYTHLFALDLSFIGWWILCGISFGIASIYAIPYYLTTQALYYENFKIRALQEGRITEDDFLSQEEKANKYAFAGAGNYYNPAQNTNEQYTANQNDSANAYYYNPQQHTSDTGAAQTLSLIHIYYYASCFIQAFTRNNV